MWICPTSPTCPRLRLELRLGVLVEMPCASRTAPIQEALGERQVFSSKGSDCPFSCFPFPSLNPAQIRPAAFIGKRCLGKGKDRNRCSSDTVQLIS